MTHHRPRALFTIRRGGVVRAAAISIALLLVSVGVAAAHDMFLKPTRYFAPANAEVRVRVLNGTFTRSENSIARNRLADASVISSRGRMKLDTTEWSVRGDTSTFHVHARDAGTYLIGASTKPSQIDQSADDFNLYLADDGIPDVLAARKQAGELQRPVRERYHKHVKTMLQIGDVRTDDYKKTFGYPAELVPLENPYALRKGATLRVRTLVDGKASANQFVQYGGLNDAGKGIEQKSARSNAEGVVSIPLPVSGVWYVKFISMTRIERDSVNYESKWASLTFQIR